MALILYVNEIPDRRGDARAGKRTLPVRFSRDDRHHRLQRRGRRRLRDPGRPASSSGLLPIPALAMLLTIPMARQVSRGLRPNYDNPYGLMAIMGVNIQLHMFAGGLLLLAYLVVLIVGAVAPEASLFFQR